jgi:hypothetical protein
LGWAAFWATVRDRWAVSSRKPGANPTTTEFTTTTLYNAARVFFKVEENIFDFKTH